jgi:hypothetical protein
MAARFWVGGAGTWDATTTTHWAATSGGAAGASAPTSADTATFDTLSNAIAYAVTIGTNAVCLDVSIAGPAAGNVTITSGATAVINVYGSWLSAATGVVFTTTSGAIVNFLATTTGKTVTTNNITLGAMTVNFNGVGGGWTLGSAFTVTAGASPTILAGTFDTGGFAMTLNSFNSSTTTNVRAINLNASVITCSGTGPVSLAATNLTFNAGTSTITCSNAAFTFGGGGQTFYNVNFTSATAAINTVSITGANTFNNLNVTTTALQKIITLSADQIVNGTLTLGATNTAQFRMSVGSSSVGAQRTLTVATLAALNDVDFRDIVAAGTSSPWSGTRIGNCLGNSNITFTAAATKYWNLAAGGNWTSTAWALTSGGAVAVNNFPLAQDSVIIENTGLTAGNTITINSNADIGSLSMATRTTALTLALGVNDPRFYGSVTLCSTLTTTGTTNPSYNFRGQGLANTFNSAGVVLKLNNFTVDCPTGSLTLQSNTTVELTATSSGTTTLTAGTFDLGGFNLISVYFSGSNATGTARTLTQGSGALEMTGGGGAVWNTTSSTGLTFTTTPTVNFTYSGAVGTRTISANTAGAINVNVTAGTDIIGLSTAANNVDFTGFAGAFSNLTRTISGNLTLSAGMTLTAGTLTTTFSGAGTQTITSNTNTMDFPVTFGGTGTTNCLDALTLGSTRALTFTGGTLNLKPGVTSTVGSFVTTGTTMKYLGSTTPGTQATISDASGTDTVTYLTIQDSNATGGATWSALSATNVDAGNNTGWFFSIPPKQAFEYTVRLRSFTQPWRF